MPSEPEKVWNIKRYCIPKDNLINILPNLETAFVNGEWYIHFFSENSNELIVILKDKSFFISKEKDDSWNDMIEYGEKVGCGRRWTENIPTSFKE